MVMHGKRNGLSGSQNETPSNYVATFFGELNIGLEHLWDNVGIISKHLYNHCGTIADIRSNMFETISDDLEIMVGHL